MLEELRVAKSNEQATHKANVRLAKELFKAEAEIRRLRVVLDNIATIPEMIFELQNPPNPSLTLAALKDATLLLERH